MSSFVNPLPSASQINRGNPSSNAFNALQAKYYDAAAWARWAGSIMENQQTSIANTLGTNNITQSLTSFTAIINSVPDYNNPGINFINSIFTNAVLTSMETALTGSLTTLSTGLGATVETAMFDRATVRHSTDRYNKIQEITASISSRGFDIPTGALLAKDTELANVTASLLADINKDILHETTTLALTNNIENRKIALQYIQIMAAVTDSKIMRDFELAKTSLLTTLEGYKAKLAMYEVKSNILSSQAKIEIDAALRHTTVEVEAFKGIAQSAAQMVSSALNGVNVSSSYSFSGSENVSYQLQGDVGTGTVIPDSRTNTY